MWLCPDWVIESTEGMMFEHVSLELGDPFMQLYPVYILQSLEHPSPSILLPSSHSKENLLPSPHI